MKSLIFYTLFIFSILCCKTKPAEEQISSTRQPFLWENATVYFMLTDRFNNGDKSNDFIHPKGQEAAALRGYMGGDVKGITQKIKEGYFDSLGVNAIWMTPLFENIQGSVDEGTGRSYGFHGYWIRDWTAYDSRIGNAADIKDMVKIAHDHGIRVIFDVIANHTGPVTKTDTKWPDEWVRTGPKCVYKDFNSTVTCTLVDNLPDIKTESQDEVKLPAFLVEKWKKEGRLDQEMKELDEFFAITKYKKTPTNYIIKWLVDLIKEFGVDGFRVDTAKHTEAEVWKVLFEEAKKAFALWKKEHPEEKLDDNEFYMVGEVYNYFIGNGRLYDFGDKKIDFFDNGFQSLINFDFKHDANRKGYDTLFTKYDNLLNNELKGKTVLNYISSHDDGGPFDKERKRSIESATKLLLTQGGAQIYYGDETARTLSADASGDAVLRSFMNWEEVNGKKDILDHWRKLGSFRKNHNAIGAGRHQKLADTPYTFSRTWNDDQVVVALDVPAGEQTINVGTIFKNGTKVKDGYTGKIYTVQNKSVKVKSTSGVVLLERQ